MRHSGGAYHSGGFAGEPKRTQSDFGGGEQVPQMQLPPLPPGSALRFNAAKASAQGRLSQSRALMNNLETEMSRLLEWAGAEDGTAGGARRRSRMDVSHSAAERHEELRDFLEGRADVHQKRAKRRELADATAASARGGGRTGTDRAPLCPSRPLRRRAPRRDQ